MADLQGVPLQLYMPVHAMHASLVVPCADLLGL